MVYYGESLCGGIDIVSFVDVVFIGVVYEGFELFGCWLFVCDEMFGVEDVWVWVDVVRDGIDGDDVFRFVVLWVVFLLVGWWDFVLWVVECDGVGEDFYCDGCGLFWVVWGWKGWGGR